MMKIEIRTDGAAFRDPYTGDYDRYAEASEIRRILENVIQRLELGYTEGSCIDTNGNRVGSWSREDWL